MHVGNLTFRALLLASVLALPAVVHAQIAGVPKASATVPGMVALGAGLEIVAPLPNGTNDTATLQALLDANPTAQIAFPASPTHWRVSNLLLSDTTGRHFSGSLIGRGGVIDCITPGNATDSDVAMQRCIAGYTQSLSGVGGDLTGFGGTIRDLTINAPTNGAAIYLTNGQNLRIENNHINGGRYSLALESSQNAGIRKNTFAGYSNAGVGLLFLSDTARVWYGAGGVPLSSFFNDGVTIAENGFSSAVPGALAHILDHGSTAEGVRIVVGNYFFSGSVASLGPRFGYLSRNAEPNITGANWFENVVYPIRTLNTNVSEGGSASILPGVTGAQPAGTYALSNIPDGYGYGGVITGNYFAKAIDDINVSGQNGAVTVGGNFGQAVSGYHLVAVQGSPHVMDLGDTVTYSGGSYKEIAYAGYTDLTSALKLATTTLAGVSTVGATGGAASYSDPRLGNVSTRAPLPTDDSAHGYAIGSLWVAPGGALYQAQQVSPGQAVWTAITTTGLPIDAVGGTAPVAAYGTVKLRAAYSGAAINVVRASDSTASDIGFVGTALDTATLDAFCANTTCTVATWYDQSGNARNATQTNAAYRPSIYSASLTGNTRSVVFDSVINNTAAPKWMTLPAAVATAGNADSVFVAGRAYSSERPATFVQLTNASYPQTLSSGTYSSFLSLTYGSPYNSANASQTPNMFGFVSASTGISVYSGSVLNSYGAQSNNPMVGGYLGTIAANTTSGASGYVEMAAVLIYGRGLSTTAEVPNLSASLNRVLGIVPQLRDVFVADGDSITEGYQATFLFNRPRQTQALLAKPMNVYDKGYFGDTIMHRVSNYAADIAPIYNPLAINNILEIAAGTNDIGGTTTDVQVEGYLQSYITAAHATGWKVIVATILPRNGFTTTQNTYLANVNTWIRAGSSGADAIADYAADPTMGNSASVTNTTYYADGTHPTTLGYGYLAPIEAAAVNGLLH